MVELLVHPDEDGTVTVSCAWCGEQFNSDEQMWSMTKNAFGPELMHIECIRVICNHAMAIKERQSRDMLDSLGFRQAIRLLHELLGSPAVSFRGEVEELTALLMAHVRARAME